MSIEQRRAVIEEAKTWMGTPFVHNTMVKGAGVGCGTLLIACYAKAGIAVPDPNALGYFPHDWHLHETQNRYLHLITQFTEEVAEPQPGDIVLFEIGKVFAHSGIVLEWPQIIHVMWRRKVEYADATKAPLDRRNPIFLSPFAS